MNKHTLEEIACDYSLFGEYIDPMNTISAEEFSVLSFDERMKLMTDCGLSELKIKEVTMKYQDFFEFKMREDESGFICLKDEAPSSLRMFIQGLHVDQFHCGFPNDWIYQVISEAFEVLETCECELDELSIEADIYDIDLIDWLQNSYAKGFCNEAIDGGFADKKNADIMQMISCGQYLAKREIYDAVNEFLKEQAHEQV